MPTDAIVVCDKCNGEGVLTGSFLDEVCTKCHGEGEVTILSEDSEDDTNE